MDWPQPHIWTTGVRDGLESTKSSCTCLCWPQAPRLQSSGGRWLPGVTQTMPSRREPFCHAALPRSCVSAQMRIINGQLASIARPNQHICNSASIWLQSLGATCMVGTRATHVINKSFATCFASFAPGRRMLVMSPVYPPRMSWTNPSSLIQLYIRVPSLARLIG